MNPTATRSALLALLLALAQGACAQSVAVAGMLGSKALVVVDSTAPKAVAAGETYRGVKVLSIQNEQVVVEIDGRRQTMRVGDAPVSVGRGGGDAGASKVVLSAGSGGHFLTLGQINGQTVQFVVDTGATMVSMSVADAQRIGLHYKNGQVGLVSTANGVIPAWRTRLNSIRIGDVTVYDVEALVSSGAMPYVLLGNSYLGRFQMTRTNDQLVLEKRY